MRVSRIALGCALAATSLPITAMAAEAQNDDGDAIIVTAQRRAENIQDTPISVTALSAETMADRGIVRTQDLAASVPSLYINNISAGPSALTVILRGAGEQVGGLATSESPVGIYLDDVYLARLSGANMELADVERVEVLRGPQGTLYGRNTMTGALKVVTHRPSETLWFRGEASFGSHELARVKAAVSGPLTDGLLASASGYFTDRGGWFTNLGADPSRGDRKTYGGRISLATGGDGPFSARLSAFYTRDQNDGITPVPVSPAAPYAPLTGAYNVTRSPLPSYGDNRQAGVIANLAYDFGDVTLTSISAYIDSADSWALDFSGGFLNSSGNVVAGFFRESASNQWQFSQELQAQGEAADGALEWIAGAYYFKEKADQVLLDSFGTGVFGPFPVALLPASFKLDTESWALFGQASYEVSPALNVTAGLRYTSDEKAFAGSIQNGFGFPATSANKTNAAKWHAWTPKFGIDYKFTDDIMAYASVSRGFRAGGFNGLAVANTTVFGAAFDPETVWAWEAGLKSQFADGKITANLAYFRNALKNLQQNVQIGGGSTRTENAADATLQGLEYELSARPFKGLNLYASGSLLFDEYDRLVPTSQAALAGAKHLPLVSRFQSQVGFSFSAPMDDTINFVLNGDWSHRSRRFADASNQALGLIPTVDRFNAGVGLEGAAQDWQLLLSVRNLTDSHDYYSGLGLIPGLIAVRFFEEPRTWSVTFRYKFGD